MIQQFTLTKQSKAFGASFGHEPIELIISKEQYHRFKKVIKVLFDKSTVKLIKRLVKD